MTERFRYALIVDATRAHVSDDFRDAFVTSLDHDIDVVPLIGTSGGEPSTHVNLAGIGDEDSLRKALALGGSGGAGTTRRPRILLAAGLDEDTLWQSVTEFIDTADEGPPVFVVESHHANAAVGHIGSIHPRLNREVTVIVRDDG